MITDMITVGHRMLFVETGCVNQEMKQLRMALDLAETTRNENVRSAALSIARDILLENINRKD